LKGVIVFFSQENCVLRFRSGHLEVFLLVFFFLSFTLEITLPPLLNAAPAHHGNLGIPYAGFPKGEVRPVCLLCDGLQVGSI